MLVAQALRHHIDHLFQRFHLSRQTHIAVFKGIVAGGEAAPNKAKLATENAGKGVFTDDLMKVEAVSYTHLMCIRDSSVTVLPQWHPVI